VTAWLRERFGSGRRPAASRWVVIDCETSGLDPQRDSLISLGAVAVLDGRISPSEAFSATLRQARPSGRDNILVHGIGGERQVAGEEPSAALSALLDFAADSPRAAWRAAFDRTVIARAAGAAGRTERGLWLDLAELMPVLFPGRAPAEATLDRWLEAFSVAHRARHDALGDAYATAQLLQVALREAGRQGFATVGAVLRAARASRWTGR